MKINKHLTSIESVPEYEVILEFTERMDPAIISESSLPFVSLKVEIDANSLSEEASKLYEQFGRIAYGAPLYIWETEKYNNWQISYIGMTIEQNIQKRFETHSGLVRLLARYVNDPKSKVFYRLCSRFDLIYALEDRISRSPIEHLPLDQARKVVNDIESKLIYQYKPEYNTLFKQKEKIYWKKFEIKSFRMG